VDPRTVSLDAYDPKEQAAKEQAALVDVVSKMRSEASLLYADVGALTRRYDAARASLEALQYEDDVDSERARGLAKMRDVKERVKFLTLSVDDAEHYSRVLAHVVKRLSEDKLAHLGKMKAFEDALRVQRAELELCQEVQRTVFKSRDEELVELARLQAEVKKQVAALDRKLEARRQEVKTRQDKAKWRIAKLAEELSLKAQAEGDLTEEEERAMIEKAKNLSSEAAALRAEKIRAQADADAAEAEFNTVRHAAGVAEPDGDDGAGGGAAAAAAAAAGGDDDAAANAFTPPETAPILARFNALGDEMRSIEEQIIDYNSRVAVLTGQLGVLRRLAEPRARDEEDEAERDVAAVPALRERAAVARRSLEAAAREAEDGHDLRMKVEQSVAVLAERLANFAPPYLGAGAGGGGAGGGGAGATPAQAETDAMAMALLAEAGRAAPTAWARGVHARLTGAVRSLTALMRVMDPAGTSAALGRAHARLALAMGASPDDVAAVTSFAPAGGAGAPAGGSEGGAAASAAAGGAPRDDGEGGGEDAGEGDDGGEVEQDRKMDATIASLIVKNEWSIRVRPGSSGPSRPVKAISGRALAEAVQAFERTWKEASAGGGGGGGGGAGGSASDYQIAGRDGDNYSKEASRQRRRNSRIELETAYVSAAVAPPVGGGGDDDDGAPGGPGGPGGKGKKGESAKPKTKDITRFLATAASMAGDDVDEVALSMPAAAAGGPGGPKREAEDVSRGAPRAGGRARSGAAPPRPRPRPALPADAPADAPAPPRLAALTAPTPRPRPAPCPLPPRAGAHARPPQAQRQGGR